MLNVKERWCPPPAFPSSQFCLLLNKNIPATGVSNVTVCQDKAQGTFPVSCPTRYSLRELGHHPALPSCTLHPSGTSVLQWDSETKYPEATLLSFKQVGRKGDGEIWAKMMTIKMYKQPIVTLSTNCFSSIKITRMFIWNRKLQIGLRQNPVANLISDLNRRIHPMPLSDYEVLKWNLQRTLTCLHCAALSNPYEFRDRQPFAPSCFLRPFGCFSPLAARPFWKAKWCCYYLLAQREQKVN